MAITATGPTGCMTGACPGLAPCNFCQLVEGFLWHATSAVRWVAGRDPGPLLRAEHGGVWELAFEWLREPVLAVLRGPSLRAVAEGRYRLDAARLGAALELEFLSL